MRLKDRVALVTGAGSGIGAATVGLFAQEGARVVISDRSVEAARQVARQVRDSGGDVHVAIGDVTSRADAERIVAETVRHYGALDVLVNSAGITGRQVRQGADFEEVFDTVIDVNLKGTYLMCWFAVPEMKKRGRGSIVNLSSIIGLVGHPLSDGFNPYPASKGGVLQLTRDLGINQARFGIRTNCICPGFTRTALTRGITEDPKLLATLEGLHPMGRLGEPEEIAKAALFLASDDASFVTGAYLAVDGGYTAR
ncbi:MAG: SDR family oxidoreductase [SAR202 cluster bacterium]|nr:SDR family oxidoreductase [SAR202 cluster bacterium]